MTLDEVARSNSGGNGNNGDNNNNQRRNNNRSNNNNGNGNGNQRRNSNNNNNNNNSDVQGQEGQQAGKVRNNNNRNNNNSGNGNNNGNNGNNNNGNNRNAPYNNNRNNNGNNQGDGFNQGGFYGMNQFGGMGGMVPMQNIDLSQQVLKVSSQSNPKGSAGSISHTVRRGQNPQVMCSGSSSINQAIKAIAIARGYLEQDGMDVSVTGSWRDREMQKVTLSIQKTSRTKRNQEEKDPDNAGDLRIAQNSQPGTVAGAIAKKVRGGEKVSMIAIGAQSVANAVMAIIIARRYLQNDGVDITFRPEFVHLQMDDEQRSGVRFNVLRHDL